VKVVPVSWAAAVWWAESVVTSRSRVKTTFVAVTTSTSGWPARAVSNLEQCILTGLLMTQCRVDDVH